MGLFSRKDKKEKAASAGPVPLYFVVYGLEDNKQAMFQDAFVREFRSPQVSLSFSRPPQDVRSGYVAGDVNDKYLTITPRPNMGVADAIDEKLVGEAVRLAANKAGASSMCPVR